MAVNECGRVTCDLVNELIEGAAERKGYRMAGRNPLFEVCGIEHAMGEIILKAVRYRAQRQRIDLLKIAAWAELVYQETMGKDDGGSA